MNVYDQLDALAARGGLSVLTLIGVGGGWQASVKSAISGSYATKRGATPGAAVVAALELLPLNEAYDLQHGTVAVVERAKAEHPAPICPVCEEPQFDTPSGATCANGHGGEMPKSVEPAGVFD